jgi:phenylacetate-coenzyme A ligase PaaK-like adenylate-forming protein
MPHLRGLTMNLSGLISGIREAKWGLKADRKELEAVSERRLRSIIENAYREAPFYSSVFRSKEITPEQIRNADDLSKLPVITNTDVIDNWNIMYSRAIEADKCIWNRTSGTTGQPTAFLHDPHTFYRLMGISLRGQINGGLKAKHRVALVRPSLLGTPTLLSHNLYRLLSLFRKVKFWATSDDVRETLRGLHKFAPDVLKTYPHFLRLATRHEEEFSCPLIFTDSEILDIDTRKTIEEAFGSRIVDLYTSVEFPSIAWECPTSSLYHIDSDAVLVESLKLHSDAPADSGERSRLVVTGLINHTMPLIRFWLGDIGVLTDEKCSCGVKLPLMKSIEGRAVDCITLPSGRVISPYALIKWMSAHSVGIKQYQIIQESRNRLVLRVVLDSRTEKETLTGLTTALTKLIVEPVVVEAKVVDSINRGPYSKERIVLSRVS